MTHPDLPEAYAKKCVEYFREQREKNPNTPLSALRLGVEDPDAGRNYGLCRCERCLRPIKLSDGREIPVQNAVKEGLTFRTTQYHLLLEAIARAMKEEFPDARFSSYAYYFAAEPPPFQTAVQPWFCPYGGGGQLRHRCYRSPLFSEYNDKWWNYAYRWSRISDVVVLRDYNGLQAKGRPFAEIVGWDVRSLRDLKVNRFANEIGGSIHDPFSQMDVWVANRIYWNPDADVSKLNAYYLRRTFREGAPAMARFFEAIHRYWYAEHKNPEDFVQLGWIILQTGKQNELHQHLKTALKTARHPMARANIARLLTTFETWFHLNLEAATAAEMLVNAKLGRHVPFSSFIDGDNPVAVSYMTVRDEKPMDSEPMYHRGNVGGMTLRIRLKPVGKAVEDKFPLPEISVSQFSPGITDRTEGSAWTMPVQGKRQKDGGYLYTIPLKKISNFATGTMGNLTIRFSYNELEWRIPNGYQPEFAVYGLELADKNGKRYADPGIEERLGKKDRARWP
jgi:hypothetical protein